MYYRENKNFVNYHDDYDYSSLYSRTSRDYSFNNQFFEDDNSLFTTDESYEEYKEDDEIGDIINAYLDNTYIDRHELIDIKPIEYENDNNIYIIKGHPRDEKYFSLPLTEDQYYMLKEHWNQQLDDEMERVKGARVISNFSLRNSEHSEHSGNTIMTINSCPELTNSDTSNHLPSQFFDSDNEKDKKKINWRQWFQRKRKTKTHKITTNFYESLTKKK